MLPFAAAAQVIARTPPRDTSRPWPGHAAARSGPFGTLRDQAAMQQAWLKKRLDTFLPPLMRKHGIDLWVVPMREYNEDPVFSSLTSAETFFARRRTIYVFFDKCAAAGTPVSSELHRAHRARRILAGRRVRRADVDQGDRRRPSATPGGALGRRAMAGARTSDRGAQAEGLGINRSKTFAFTDGLSSGELQGMSARPWGRPGPRSSETPRRCRSS